jgi:hypothetical protein
MKTLSDHISVPAPQRDLEWLKGALQTAIELEQSTLPLYLAAMYSLKIQNYPSYNRIRSVAMEEMVHMAIACNVLAAIGGTPRIKYLCHGFPSHGLPGGAEPDLRVGLGALTKTQLKNFMRVELPSFLLPEAYTQEAYPTISKLYDGIRSAIETNADAIRAAMKKGGTSNQIGDDIGFTTLRYTEGQDPLPQVYQGIDEILTQGEGSPMRTLHTDAGSEGEEAHYAKFAEIYYGHAYQVPSSGIVLTQETEAQFFGGVAIPVPEVVNTLWVPKDGYEQALKADPNGASVEASLLAFDQAYTGILSNLDAMWNGSSSQSWPTFGKAVAAMGELRVLACFNIMKCQVPAPVVAKLAELYASEYNDMKACTDLGAPVYYGPRFLNLNAQKPPSLGR